MRVYIIVGIIITMTIAAIGVQKEDARKQEATLTKARLDAGIWARDLGMPDAKIHCTANTYTASCTARTSDGAIFKLSCGYAGCEL